MSYIEQILHPGERIVYDAPASKLMYVPALINFALSMYPKGLLSIHATRIALTNTRLLGVTGFLGRTTIALPYKKIAVVNVNQGLFGKFLDYGTVTVVSTDGVKTKFKGILWPLVLQQEVDDAIEMAVLGRKLSDYAAPTD